MKYELRWRPNGSDTNSEFIIFKKKHYHLAIVLYNHLKEKLTRDDVTLWLLNSNGTTRGVFNPDTNHI